MVITHKLESQGYVSTDSTRRLNHLLDNQSRLVSTGSTQRLSTWKPLRQGFDRLNLSAQRNAFGLAQPVGFIRLA